MSLTEGYEKILMSDIWEALEHLYKSQIKGTRLDPDSECHICESIFQDQGSNFYIDENRLISFGCGHIFHDTCIQPVHKRLLSSGSPSSSPRFARQEYLNKSIKALYNRRERVFIRPKTNRVDTHHVRYQCPICCQTASKGDLDEKST